MLPGQSAVWGLLLYIQINILLSVEPALYDYIIHVLLLIYKCRVSVPNNQLGLNPLIV